MTNGEKAAQEGCYFDEDAAQRAVAFIERYVIPSTIGKPIKLLDWQRTIVSQIFGNKRADGRLRYKRATISTGKKQGKTVLVSAILAYGLLGDICPSPFVASASTSRENAGQVYRELAYSFKNHPKLKRVGRLKDTVKEIVVASKAARYRAFSADAGASEGENLSLCVVDETHAHVSDRLYRALEYSTIARPDGLFVNISTAGSDQGHFWYDIFKYAQQVQEDKIVDTSLYPFICTIPDNADIDDVANWRKSCPSLGVSFSEEDFARDLARAKAGGTADLLSFRRYRLNQWCMSENAWIDTVKFDVCTSPMTDEQLKEYPLFVGLDASQTTDPTSISCVWALPERRFYVKSHALVCEEGVRRREQSNLPKYKTFQADGCMTITSGNVNDYRLLKKKILDIHQQFKIKEMVVDQYNVIELAAELMSEGITVFRQPQTHRYFTSPIKEFEVAINEKRIQHDGKQSFLRWALNNTRLDYDNYSNVKPSRDKSTDKIDATISTVMAFGRAVEASVSGSLKKSVYEGRGILML